VIDRPSRLKFPDRAQALIAGHKDQDGPRRTP
jgi:hypothetical protein